jgi:lipoyl(octanoyl) transferase
MQTERFFIYNLVVRKEWRLIDSGPCSASYNMALDEAVAAAAREKTQPPTLRLYGWESVSLSLGCFQDVSGINLAYCSARGIPIVRRPTGGRAVLHDRELTYSFSCRTDSDPFSKGLLDSYRRIGAALHLALARTGISCKARKERERGTVLAGSPLCFQTSSLGEILADNRKVIGSAQKRWSDGLLQQGSIPYFHNLEEMCRVFGIDETTAMGARAAGVMEMAPGLSEEEFRGMIREAFEETFDIRFVQSGPSPGEVSLARGLEREKYLQPRWNFHRRE